MYEVSPDYGMMTQDWNISGFGKSIIEQFFGIKPLAYLKEITITPMLPAEWTDGKIEKVDIGNNEVTIRFSQKVNAVNFEIVQKSGDWKILFKQPKGKYAKWEINSKTVNPDSVSECERTILTGTSNSLELVK